MADAAACYVTPGSVVTRGTAFNVVCRFWSVDPIEGTSTLADPDEVEIRILAPDSTVQTFAGSSPKVSNPAYGVFVLALDPQLPTGIYYASCIGSGGVDAQSGDEAFTIVDSTVDDPSAPPPRPVMGPCTQWITGQDVANCARAAGGDTNPVIPAAFETAAYNASLALFEISDRRFPGICTRTVRPCRADCGCWMAGPPSYGFGPWFWTSVPYGYGGWAWYNENGDKFGCSPMSKVKLAGYPVVEILSVVIDGEELSEFDPDSGARNWRLDKWRYLVRMDSPGPPVQPKFWPSCQNMSLDADQPGTFAIQYRWGQDVPQLGRDAAVELAYQFYLQCSGASCVLPAGATRVVRQGIEIDRGLLANWMNPSQGTGLVQLDTFLQAYAGGKRAGRRSAIWSPDVQSFARRVGINDGPSGS